jgi:hypothetical protein
MTEGLSIFSQKYSAKIPFLSVAVSYIFLTMLNHVVFKGGYRVLKIVV